MDGSAVKLVESLESAPAIQAADQDGYESFGSESDQPEVRITEQVLKTLTLLVLYLNEFNTNLACFLQPIASHRTCLKSEFENLLKKANILSEPTLDTSLFEQDSSRLLIDKIAFYVETLYSNHDLLNTGIALLDQQIAEPFE